MASTRVEPSNRLHEAAARPDGLAEVKQLVEIEKLDINQLHSEFGTSPIAFAAESGSLDTLRYLVECKARIEQPKGKYNLLQYALPQNGSPDKIKYIASLYRDFKDNSTELHLAVACRDLEKIKELISKDLNSIYVVDDHRKNPIMWAVDFDDFEIANLLLSHADRSSDQFQENLEYFLNGMCTRIYNPEDTLKYRNAILSIIPIIEPLKTIRAQLTRYAFLLLADDLHASPNNEAKYKLVNDALELISSSKNPVLSDELAWSFYNISIDVSMEDRLRSLLLEASLLLMSNSQIKIECVFRYAIRAQLSLNQGVVYIRKLANRIATILDAKEVKLAENNSHNCHQWMFIIYELMKDQTREVCEVITILIRLVLRIAPNKTLDNKILIAKLHFIQIQHLLKLGDHELANRILCEYKLENGVTLSDDAIDELIIATAEFAKNNNFTALTYALELATHEKFIERLKLIISTRNHWKEILPLLEALYAKKFVESFPPNILIAGIPFIIHIAKDNQYEILKFLFERTSVMSDSVLTSSIPVEVGDMQNCTALYVVGIGGDSIIFRYLLERIPALYSPEPTTHTKPFIHALLENAAKDFSKFSGYYKILEMVTNKYPDEINKVWKGETIADLLNRLHPSIKICLGPASRSKEIKMQFELESQIRREIINNNIINTLLSGAEKLSVLCFYENRQENTPVDGTTVLRENIEMLDSLINPYSGTGWIRVSESFYNTEFLPWKLKCESDASCYGENVLPVIEVRNSQQMIKEINTIISLIHDYFTRSIKTPLIKSKKSDDLICYRDIATSPAEEKKNEPVSRKQEPSLAECVSLTIFKPEEMVSSIPNRHSAYCNL